MDKMVTWMSVQYVWVFLPDVISQMILTCS